MNTGQEIIAGDSRMRLTNEKEENTERVSTAPETNCDNIEGERNKKRANNKKVEAMNNVSTKYN